MKNKEKNHSAVIYILLLCLIFAITAFSGTVALQDDKNVQIHETVLLNPKYDSLVNVVRVYNQNTGDAIEFKKTPNGFVGHSSEIAFPVNSTKILELIKLSSTPIDAQLISSEAKNLIDYDVAESSQNAINVSFLGLEQGSVVEYSSLIFGTSDFTATRRYVRSTQNNNIYVITDDFYSFLFTHISAWIDPKIVPEILLTNRESSNIEALSLEIHDLETILYSVDSFYESAIHTLLSLQSSVVVDAKQYNNKTIDATVRIFPQSGDTIILNMYKKSDTSYVIVPYTSQLLYALEISAYTYERILSAFIG